MNSYNNTYYSLKAQALRAKRAKDLAEDEMFRKAEGILVAMVLIALTIALALSWSGVVVFNL